MQILSLDLSTKNSGWAIFDNHDLKEYGAIPATSTDVIKRIYKIVSEI